MPIGDEVDGNLTAWEPSFKYASRYQTAINGYLQFQGQGGDVGETAVFDFLVGRHDHTNIMAHCFKRFGQRAGNVTQPARFGKGVYFGTDKEDFE